LNNFLNLFRKFLQHSNLKDLIKDLNQNTSALNEVNINELENIIISENLAEDLNTLPIVQRKESATQSGPIESSDKNSSINEFVNWLSSTESGNSF
jgi:hypothetical protein